MSKTCNICYEDKSKNKFFNYKCCSNASMCSTCMVKHLTVCGDCCVYHFDCPFCKKHNYFDYEVIEKFTKDELYILLNKYMEALMKSRNLLNNFM